MPFGLTAHLMKRPIDKFFGQSTFSGIFQEFAIVFLGPFPPTNDGLKYINLEVEKLSRNPIAKAVKDQLTITAVELVKNEIVCNYGCPKVLTLDGGSCFISPLFKSFATEYEIQQNYTPAYQPGWNGTVERLNRSIRYA